MNKLSEKEIIEYEELLEGLTSFHEQFTRLFGLRYALDEDNKQKYGGFDIQGAWAIISTSIMLTRHLNAAVNLLNEKYPVQATILLRAIIETWFYLIMFFKYPDRASDYLKEPLNKKGRPKYRPFEVKKITIEILKQTTLPMGNELSKYLEESYKQACGMVHVSDPSIFASFGLTVGEEKLKFSSSSNDDTYLRFAFEQVTHISSTFWLIYLFEVMPEDESEYSLKIRMNIMDYLKQALKLVKGWNVPW